MNDSRNDQQQPAQNPPAQPQSGAPEQANADSGEHSYAGQLDHVEGNTNNGELGGGLKKAEEEEGR